MEAAERIEAMKFWKYECEDCGLHLDMPDVFPDPDEPQLCDDCEIDRERLITAFIEVGK